MRMGKTWLIVIAILALWVSLVESLHRRSEAGFKAQNANLLQQNDTLKTENERLSGLASRSNASNATASDAPSTELLRLRGEVARLRRQNEDLTRSLAKVQSKPLQVSRSQDQPSAQPQDPEEYPTTPESATAGIFQSLMQGDLQNFFTNFAEPGVPKEVYDKIFNTDRVKAYLAEIDSVSVVGQPTNSFGSNMWFVPYRLRFKNGSEKEWQLHIAQDPQSQKWYFKGGF